MDKGTIVLKIMSLPYKVTIKKRVTIRGTSKNGR